MRRISLVVVDSLIFLVLAKKFWNIFCKLYAISYYCSEVCFFNSPIARRSNRRSRAGRRSGRVLGGGLDDSPEEARYHTDLIRPAVDDVLSDLRASANERVSRARTLREHFNALSDSD